MKTGQSAAWQEMEIRGALVYFSLILAVYIVAFAMLVIANVDVQGILLPSVPIGISLFCAYRTYQRKKSGRPVTIFAWIASSLFVMMPVFQKFNYVKMYGWEVALASYNSSVTIIIAVVIIQFLYDRTLFRVLSVLAITGWLAFLVAAFLAGAPMSIHSVVDGRNVNSFVVLREVFIMLVSVIVWFAVYRIIPITENYDRKTTEQRLIIEAHNELLETQVRERTAELYALNEILRERNTRVESELDMARLILNRLMPESTVSVDGLDFYALNVSMDKVGGDFYGFKQAAGSLEMLLADVSGHGLQAAFLSLITKMTYDNSGEWGNPAKTLEELNRTVCRSTVRGNFVTALCCDIDTRKRVVRYAGAGHWPGVVCGRKDGTVNELAVRGMPLGWKRGITYAVGEREVAQGDRIILYTDGIIECANSENDLFGTERLFAFARGNSHLSPREFSESLLSHLHEFTETNAFKDDLSIIVCDING